MIELSKKKVASLSAIPLILYRQNTAIQITVAYIDA